MSAELAKERRRSATLLLALGAVFAIASAAVTSFDLDRLKPPKAEGLVLPSFAKDAAAADTITIATKDATYHIARTQRGWSLRDRGDYPVERARLAQFTAGLESLSYVRAMTRDPGKLDRLGLGDPAKGGDGVLLQVQNAQGALLANVIVGITPNGLYMRDPNQSQAWAVKGDLPPLKDPAQWLDLAPLSLNAARIARVLVEPAAGPSYALVREDAQARDFTLDKPYEKYLVLTPMGLDAAGGAFASIRPMDVAGAPAIVGAARARVTAHTFDGLVIIGELFEQGGRRWLKLVAHGDNPAAETEAQAINARAAAWAYGLSELDYESFAPPLSQLVRAPGAPSASQSESGAAPAAPKPPQQPPPQRPQE